MILVDIIDFGKLMIGQQIWGYTAYHDIDNQQYDRGLVQNGCLTPCMSKSMEDKMLNHGRKFSERFNQAE